MVKSQIKRRSGGRESARHTGDQNMSGRRSARIPAPQFADLNADENRQLRKIMIDLSKDEETVPEGGGLGGAHDSEDPNLESYQDKSEDGGSGGFSACPRGRACPTILLYRRGLTPLIPVVLAWSDDEAPRSMLDTSEKGDDEDSSGSPPTRACQPRACQDFFLAGVLTHPF